MMARSQQQANAKEQAVVLSKPKQPLSAYNLFFQVERKRILAGTNHLQLPVTNQELQAILSGHKEKVKRVHRKTHGKIGFRELARTIASRWKKVDIESRKIYDEQAVIHKDEYLKNLEVWKIYKAKEEAREEALLDERQDTDEDLTSVFQQEHGIFDFNQSPALHHLQELNARNNAMMEIPTSLPFAASFNSAYYPTDLARSISLVQSAIRALSRDQQQAQDINIYPSQVQSSAPVEQKSLGSWSDHNMMMASPIFNEARLAGYDLFDSLDASAMEQVFLE